MSWSNTTSHDRAVDSAPALGALRAVLAAAERLGVARDELLAAASAAAAGLDGVDRAMLARLHPADTAQQLRPDADAEFLARVRCAMRKLTAEARCSVESVACELAVSPRTLQRRLERAGTTFGAVSDDIRRDAALEHLRNPRVAIKEAAFLLGFSEPSTFYRAFRRWTGDTPANFRRTSL
jgi:AraC-like DNA-binding protein